MTTPSLLPPNALAEAAEEAARGQASAQGQVTFSQVSPQGFGDRHNSWAWSMLWWKGKLYVGTNRAWLCAERAAISAAFPFFAKLPFVRYPPDDPDAECTPDPTDLPLRAEIWRWTPETGEWERVYQSPQDVPIPGHPGKYVAREVGLRSMAVWVESDGAEALYVSGVSSQFIYEQRLPPRLLRSTDGRVFEPVPQDPGTLLGELDVSTFRTIRAYEGRMFILAGVIYGDGVLLESRNPAGGNDEFQQVSPPEMRIFEMQPFNGHLYLGLRDTRRGYAIVRTDASGAPPYAFTPVVTDGAFLTPPSQSVISMHVYKGQLYVGTDRPAELIRINPDDTWDLVIGTPRETPDGWKYPLSGLDAGLHNWLNGHIWRMQEYQGHLYLGTMNMGTHFRNTPGAEAVLKPNFGCDLYETADGWHFSPITTTGFGDRFNFGLRSFAATPHGLFAGTANSCYGLQIWRGVLEDRIGKTEETNPALSPAGHGPDRTISARLPPTCLEVEMNGRKVVLSWDGPAGAKRFRVWRAIVADQRSRVEVHPFLAPLLRILRLVLRHNPQLYLPPLPRQLWIPGTYAEIGVTERSYFEDPLASEDERYLYYVCAEYDQGDLSRPSNIAAAPPLIVPVTFAGLLATLNERAAGRQNGYAGRIQDEFKAIYARLQLNDVSGVEQQLRAQLRRLVEDQPAAPDPLFVDDLQVLLRKLMRRVALSRAGVISTTAL